MNKGFFRHHFSLNRTSKIICVYPGRFQPFGPHHREAYNHLCQKFGKENVFVATSETLDANNPLSFREKRDVMIQSGVSNIVQVVSPYRPVEITSNFHSDVALVLAIGEKDSERFSNPTYSTNKSTNRYYYHKFDESDIDNMASYRQRGYVYIIPHIDIQYEGIKIDGTYLRKIIPELSEVEFVKVMGWKDASLFKMLKTKLNKNIAAMQESAITPFSANSSGSKHLNHPWEVLDLSFIDILELARKLLHGENFSATEKIDGQNILITYDGIEFRCARNKSEIKNPLTREGLVQKFFGKEAQSSIFVPAFDSIVKYLSSLPEILLEQKFRSGTRFLNIEIYLPEFKNVIDYGGEPFFVFHNMIEYNESGNEISRISADSLCGHSTFGVAVRPPNRISLKKVYNADKYYAEFEESVGSLWKKFGMKATNTIGDFLAQTKNAKEVIYPLEIAFSKLGVVVLSEIDSLMSETKFKSVQDIRKNIARIQTRVHSSNDSSTIKKFNTEMSKLNAVGGLSSLMPIEGIVFEYKGFLMKLTGSFRFVNQILGIGRYSK